MKLLETQMGKEVLVRLEVPIPCQPIVPVPAMIFHCWLPIKEDEFLVLEEESFKVKLWFDITCTYWASQMTQEDLPSWQNVTAHRIFIDVVAKNLSDKLVTLITSGASYCLEEDPDAELLLEYKRLGERVVETAIKYLNRLISYFRNEKGQYWLEEYVLDIGTLPGINAEFKAKAKVLTDNSEWFRWKPSIVDSRTLSLENDSRYLKRDEWQKVANFVYSSKKPTLVLQLLSNAENLAKNGNRRAAIIEAVSALELAVHNFSRDPKFDEIVGTISAKRIDVDSFASQVEHLGFSATMRYLFPLLFEEKVLPTELIKKCQDAVMVRGNVVHNGQRDVDENELLVMLQAIRQMCVTLRHFSR